MSAAQSNSGSVLRAMKAACRRTSVLTAMMSQVVLQNQRLPLNGRLVRRVRLVRNVLRVKRALTWNVNLKPFPNTYVNQRIILGVLTVMSVLRRVLIVRSARHVSSVMQPLRLVADRELGFRPSGPSAEMNVRREAISPSASQQSGPLRRSRTSESMRVTHVKVRRLPMQSLRILPAKQSGKRAKHSLRSHPRSRSSSKKDRQDGPHFFQRNSEYCFFAVLRLILQIEFSSICFCKKKRLC
jgi:hypothetical protein